MFFQIKHMLLDVKFYQKDLDDIKCGVFTYKMYIIFYIFDMRLYSLTKSCVIFSIDLFLEDW